MERRSFLKLLGISPAVIAIGDKITEAIPGTNPVPTRTKAVPGPKEADAVDAWVEHVMTPNNPMPKPYGEWRHVAVSWDAEGHACKNPPVGSPPGTQWLNTSTGELYYSSDMHDIKGEVRGTAWIRYREKV